jgi:hypothetical protein
MKRSVKKQQEEQKRRAQLRASKGARYKREDTESDYALKKQRQLAGSFSTTSPFCAGDSAQAAPRLWEAIQRGCKHERDTGDSQARKDAEERLRRAQARDAETLMAHLRRTQRHVFPDAQDLHERARRQSCL